ncbi:MAG: anhydro-N-acetylmuramic acid kinase [Chitinophagales bacterium]|nr:anhydro-N-acetylmuramic acid kinase [Chitinophagales bacterium]
MSKNSMKFVGLMSGSSLDGLDIALCQFDKKGNSFTGSIEKAITIPFPKPLAKRLSQGAILDAYALSLLDHDFGKWCGEQVAKHFSKETFTAIASHGHTLLHHPEKGFSLQIGHGAAMATAAQRPVVCDFRNNDIANGGQGAPLVPFGELHLFEKVDAFINLGGIANISFLKGPKPVAYDVCACNQWLNAAANIKRKPFDKDGKLALKGTANIKCQKALESWKFYQLPAPKSLSNQAVMQQFQKALAFDLKAEDLSATLVEHISAQLSAALLRFAPKGKGMICGGGAFHPLLIQKIQQKSNWQLIIPDSIKVQYKEAFIFAFLGYCRWKELPNTVSKLTGAKKDTCSGAIYLP